MAMSLMKKVNLNKAQSQKLQKDLYCSANPGRGLRSMERSLQMFDLLLSQMARNFNSLNQGGFQTQSRN